MNFNKFCCVLCHLQHLLPWNRWNRRKKEEFIDRSNLTDFRLFICYRIQSPFLLISNFSLKLFAKYLFLLFTNAHDCQTHTQPPTQSHILKWQWKQNWTKTILKNTRFSNWKLFLWHWFIYLRIFLKNERNCIFLNGVLCIFASRAFSNIVFSPNFISAESKWVLWQKRGRKNQTKK